MNSTKTGLIVAAAFIGPGTVTTASLAGAQLGYGLLWALIFSVFATYILQEMAARLGLVTRQGFSENLNQVSQSKWIRYSLIVLVVAALGIGNSAYEGGNITGAAMGLSSVLLGELSTWVWILGIIALLLIWSNSYRLIESILIALVAIMSLVFILVMAIAGFDLNAVAEGLKGIGLFDNTTLLLAIIGTTIVPYNLFLHASLSATQSKQSAFDINNGVQMQRHKKQLLGSIGIGGLVTFAIMSCAANAFFLTQSSMSSGNIADQLRPLLGDYAQIFYASGLFAAGLTSAITAPLATAYALAGLFNLSPDIRQLKFKLMCSTVVAIGMAIALSGIKPYSIIVVAQSSNALLLPISAALLLYLMNQTKVMGMHTNKSIHNVLAAIVIIVVLGLATNKLV